MNFFDKVCFNCCIFKKDKRKFVHIANEIIDKNLSVEFILSSLIVSMYWLLTLIEWLGSLAQLVKKNKVKESENGKGLGGTRQPKPRPKAKYQLKSKGGGREAAKEES